MPEDRIAAEAKELKNIAEEVAAEVGIPMNVFEEKARISRLGVWDRLNAEAEIIARQTQAELAARRGSVLRRNPPRP